VTPVIGLATHAPRLRGAGTLCGTATTRIADVLDDVTCTRCARDKDRCAMAFGWVRSGVSYTRGDLTATLMGSGLWRIDQSVHGGSKRIDAGRLETRRAALAALAAYESEGAA
jgi:hypothetical protein